MAEPRKGKLGLPTRLLSTNPKEAPTITSGVQSLGMNNPTTEDQFPNIIRTEFYDGINSRHHYSVGNVTIGSSTSEHSIDKKRKHGKPLDENTLQSPKVNDQKTIFNDRKKQH